MGYKKPGPTGYYRPGEIKPYEANPEILRILSEAGHREIAERVRFSQEKDRQIEKRLRKLTRKSKTVSLESVMTELTAGL